MTFTLNDKPVVTGRVFDDLNRMHKRFGFHAQKFDKKALLHRVDFLQEELNEIKLAIIEGDAAGVLDGLIDLKVVAAGTVDLAKANGDEAWRRVMDANNSKEVGFNESRPNSEGVDLVKPEGWMPPDLSDLTGMLEQILAEDYQPEPVESTPVRRAVVILQQCIELMLKKMRDYNAPGSPVQAADYYPKGVDDLIYMIDTVKRLRMISVLHNLKTGVPENFESLGDTIKDRIVYLSFMHEYVDGEMAGQDPNNDMWNRRQSDISVSSTN